ncbi:MAG: ABC transporter permease, partial [Bacteroidales bacterium]|nr:ABC transporter permease [Bacteroidales bacterium]
MGKFYYYIRIFLKNFSTYTMGVMGLSVGIAISILIFLWVYGELNYDKFNSDYDKTYRLIIGGTVNNNYEKGTGLEIPLYKECLSRFAEIEQGTILHPDFADHIDIKYNGTHYFESNLAIVDTNFLNFFDYKIITGDVLTALNAPNKVVVAENLANQLFDKSNPIGKTITVFGRDFEVGAVMENMPSHSHLKANILVPVWSLDWLQEPGRGYNLYFKLSDKVDKSKLAEQIAKLKTGFSLEEFEFDFIFQPLKEIRFSTDIQFDFVTAKTAKGTIITVGVLAFIILVLAAINFTNLFISTLFVRAKSVCIRKVNGAGQLSVLMDLIIETGTYVLIASLLGLWLASAFVPYFNSIAQSEIIIQQHIRELSLFLILLVVVITIATGIYPARVLLKTFAAKSLQNKGMARGASKTQKTLLIIQFAASIAVLIGTAVVQRQLNYSLNMDLGMNTSNVIHFNPYGAFAGNYAGIKNELIKHPAIIDVTAKRHSPLWVGDIYQIQSSQTGEQAKLTEFCFVKDNYFDFMEISLTKGSSLAFYHDSVKVALINQAMQNEIGFKEALGQRLQADKQFVEVKGVVTDIKKSVHRIAEPQIYMKLDKVSTDSHLLIKTTDDRKAALAHIHQLWEQKVPDRPFIYSFLEDSYAASYVSEKNISAVLQLATFITLLITLLGLVALVKYTVEQRTKEIGIRKVNGAKVSEILAMLNNDFIKWVAIAFVIACPVAWFA